MQPTRVSAIRYYHLFTFVSFVQTTPFMPFAHKSTISWSLKFSLKMLNSLSNSSEIRNDQKREHAADRNPVKARTHKNSSRTPRHSLRFFPPIAHRWRKSDSLNLQNLIHTSLDIQTIKRQGRLTLLSIRKHWQQYHTVYFLQYLQSRALEKGEK